MMDRVTEFTTEVMNKIAIPAGGLVWPTVGWVIHFIPGFVPRPPLTYNRQIIRPPRLAWVDEGASDADIFLRSDRSWRRLGDVGAVSLSTNRMHEINKKARRIVDISAHVNYLKKRQQDAQEAAIPVLIEYDDQTKAFLKLMEEASKDVDQASKFPTDLVRLVNPLAGKVDKMFAWGITPFCETSHAGMKQTFTQMMQSFQMIDVSNEGRVTLKNNALHRRINFLGDALLARNFSRLPYNIIRQLAHLSNIDDVVALVIACRQCTMQMDYLHETDFHRQDCIWKSKYGCFLQCFQVHLAVKRLAGNPSQKHMQGHRLFLVEMHRSIRTVRFACFLQSYLIDELRGSGECPFQSLVHMEELYCAYCDDFETHADEPSRLCAIFMKEVESYFRCVHAVKQQHFWMLEKEGCEWLGAYKLSGKTMYVTETLKRMELLYGEKLEDHELEEMRCNRLPLLSKGANAVSYDELNELLNLWDKQCSTSTDFSVVCEQSASVMALRKCGYESYGRKQSRASIRHSSQKMAMKRIIDLLNEAQIFQVDKSEGRKMTPDFFWNFVKKPKNVGSKKEKDREKPVLSAAHRYLFDQLCPPAGHTAYEEFDVPGDEDDDDVISVVSSAFGGGNEGEQEMEDLEGPGTADKDWSRLDAKELDSQIGESLKHLGNVQKKCMSKNILKDMLGKDGANAIKDIKVWREKKLAKEAQKISMIFLACIHFNKKMKIRCARLKNNHAHSKAGTFSRR